MNLPTLKIGSMIASVPIIQGGMGVGVSLSGLAGAVAKAGGIGVISSVQIGFREEDFLKNTLEANKRALVNEIRKAREIAKDGILGVNLLAAMTNYRELLVTAIKEKIDLIITGAGLPLDLPAFVKGTNTKIAPIVSSGKAAKLISKVYDTKFGVTADLFIIEGPKAGGHLGFKENILVEGGAPSLDNLLLEVKEAVKPFEEKYHKKIPLVVAGGIFSGFDLAHYLKLGAEGVQMGTRFVATDECDANLAFKQSYVESKQEDMILIKSPVGMPGRAISNDFTDKLIMGKIPVKRCYNCLIPCDPKTTPYCISDALMNSADGEEGLVFAGENAHLIKEIVPVKDLITELMKEAEMDLIGKI